MRLPQDTTLAIGQRAERCESRSLFAGRFADPTSKEEARKAWFDSFIAKRSALPSGAQAGSESWHPTTSILLRARLQFRLMVNMAGGVMENAGLSLDRYGLPLIPGSAVKGCARRASLAALREWCEAGTKPEDDENLFTPICAEFKTPAELLTRICLIFGWGELDWSTEKNKNDTWKSDFAWACNGVGAEWKSSSQSLLSQFKGKAVDENAPWESLPNFAGSIAFLSASPNRDPGLVLDVVTPHHTKYYESNDSRAIATDTEEPIPVIFPAVKEQAENDYFTFPLIPLRGARQELISFAKLVLSSGLETFGLGAKTNAGYGWFDASEVFNQSISDAIAAKSKAEAEERGRKVQAEKDAREAEARRNARETRAAMAPDEFIASLTGEQFDAKVRAFWKEPKKGGPSDEEKKAIIAALKEPRRAYWQDLKAKAAKGGDLAKSEQAIRTLNKQLNGDKMP
jgi:CRISPR-associated protein Cmr6